MRALSIPTLLCVVACGPDPGPLAGQWTGTCSPQGLDPVTLELTLERDEYSRDNDGGTARDQYEASGEDAILWADQSWRANGLFYRCVQECGQTYAGEAVQPGTVEWEPYLETGRGLFLTGHHDDGEDTMGGDCQFLEGESWFAGTWTLERS